MVKDDTISGNLNVAAGFPFHKSKTSQQAQSRNWTAITVQRAGSMVGVSISCVLLAVVAPGTAFF